MKTSEKQLRTSAEIKKEIESFPRHQRLLRLNILALRERVDNLKVQVLTHCLQGGSEVNFQQGTDQNAIDNRQVVFSGQMTIENLFQPLAASEAVLRVLEDDPMHQQALAKIQPLIDELHAAEAAELALASQAAHALREARELARQDFESKIDEQPQVVKAKSLVEPYLRKGILIEA